MSYVDSKTMKEFRVKMVNRFEEDEEKIKKAESKCDNHTLCRLSMKKTDEYGKDYDSPLFEGKAGLSMTEDADFVFCLGNRKWYCHNRNGNGFPAASNDYLHQRKRYTDFTCRAETVKFFTWKILLEFLFGANLINDLLEDGNYLMEVVSNFPGTAKPSTSIEFTFKPDPATFMDEMNKNGYAKYLKQSGKTAGFLTKDGDYFAYRGRIYIAENPYEVKGNEGTVAHFCERIYGYMHIIISMKNYQDSTRITIGQLADK